MSLLEEIDKCMTKMTEHKNAARHLMQMALEERNQSSIWEKQAEELLKKLEALEANGETDE